MKYPFVGDEFKRSSCRSRYQPEDKNDGYSSYTFISGGTQPEHFYQRSYTSEAKFDITSQVTNQHEVTFGLKK